uniref:Uncharacterized protein n=1 Tax=Prolemur simus TaxID=1328070 RepID=A0A8C9DFC4_PROSS
MRLRLLLSTLLLLLTLLPSGKSVTGHCLNLSGICRRDTCKVSEDIIAACRRRWKCCRVWWILIPIPTPVGCILFPKGCLT